MERPIYMTKETDLYDKRDRSIWQKRPTSSLVHHTRERAPWGSLIPLARLRPSTATVRKCQKTPIYMAKETYSRDKETYLSDKRDLFKRQRDLLK